MNKIIKASHSHYQAQRDLILSELDILINRSSKEGDTEKVIKLIKELSDVNSCINTIELIMRDNSSNLSELDELARQLDEKLNKQENN